MTYVRTTGVVLLALLLGACQGDVSRQPTGDGGPFQPTANVDADPAPACSAGGTVASCDPVTGGGCGSGHCYLIASQGASCVCTAGTATEGQDCNTTTDCAPGSVCAGTSPPGKCRKACTPSGSSCLSGTFCRTIDAFPSYGYCDEQ